MKVWLSASEIAALGLPGLPATKRNINVWADRNGWDAHPEYARPRAGRGGGLEYHIHILPADARAAYIARHVEMVELPASVAREAASEPGAAHLNGPASEARDARLALLTLADRTASEGKLARKVADRHFADLYNAGRVDVAGWIKAEVKSLTPRTLARWRAARVAGKTVKLAVDRAAARRGTGVLDRAEGGAVKTFMLALLAKQPQLTAHHLRALACERFPTVRLHDRTQPLPPIRTFQHALKAWRNEYRNELTAIRDPDGFKSRVRFAARVANAADRLNEVWQIDASPADVLLVDGRYSIYACVDVWSRRLVALVSKTPRASAVGLLIRKAIKAWGIPERIKTDNGSDFVARETQRLFAALGIEHDPAAPFSPEQKGHVERVIGTLQRGLMRTLEGFVGHSVADRKIIEGRKSFARRLGEAPEDAFEVRLTAIDLQQRLDEWCAVTYGNAAHAGLDGMSPFARAASYAGPIRRIEDDRALDMLLMPVAGKDGRRVVTKTGIRIDGACYLGGFLNVGDEVHVRMDPADLGRAYVYSLDGVTFLGEVLCPELAGIDPAEAIAKVRAEQKRIMDERLAEVRREARAIKAKDIAPAIHRQALVDAGKLAEFPKRVIAHSTPEIAAALDAAQGLLLDKSEPVHAPDVIALQARLIAEERHPIVRPLRTEETAHQRWQRARALEDAIASGRSASDEDLLWLGGYRTGPEYRGFALTYGVSLEEKNPAEAGRGSL
jgi:transposase InsO family protein